MKELSEAEKQVVEVESVNIPLLVKNGHLMPKERGSKVSAGWMEEKYGVRRTTRQTLGRQGFKMSMAGRQPVMHLDSTRRQV